ncbi:hypothetical protein A3717_29295 [Alcanivorax sp. HI0013]|nr:hypothetical protein A3717_00315 [Alcanivorax sp. HI0013]KZX86837.1 hypothetical protein A3717_29295 [Alcanivorax sp. HI0013]
MVALSLVFRFYSVEGKTLSGARGKRLYVVAGRKDGGNGTGEGCRGELGKESIRGGTPAPTRGAGISA